MDIGAEGGLHQEPCGTATLKASWGGGGGGDRVSEKGKGKKSKKELSERRH